MRQFIRSKLDKEVLTRKTERSKKRHASAAKTIFATANLEQTNTKSAVLSKSTESDLLVVVPEDTVALKSRLPAIIDKH